MTLSIHCTLVETSATSDPFVPGQHEFRDLVPWADPYIAALLDKLRRSEAQEINRCESRIASELPADGGVCRHARQDHWSPRNWPRGS